MPATVIHCRYAAQVPAGQYVYCGRPSKWGNPYVVGRGAGPAPRGAVDRPERASPFNRAEAIACFRHWFYEPEQAQLRADAVRELADKVLGCWCKPKPCHVDVIADYVNSHASPAQR